MGDMADWIIENGMDPEDDGRTENEEEDQYAPGAIIPEPAAGDPSAWWKQLHENIKKTNEREAARKLKFTPKKYRRRS